MKILLIDSSYFNFFRFNATKSWYMWSDERKAAAEGVDWIDNPEYMAKYEKMWFETIKKLEKQFKPDKIIFARDSREVWRHKIYPEYKSTRLNTESEVGSIFKLTNKEYHNRVKNATVIHVPEAEADDIISVVVNYFTEDDITIITGDHDLLQLCKEKVQIYNLKGKKFTNITVSDPNAAKMQKILCGDPSDNIPSAFPRCGKKTAEKLIKDSNLLNQWMDKHGDKQYKLNCTLIDFSNIPSEIYDIIKSKLN